MHIAIRSSLTAGIAVIGAGAIALSPVQPLPDHAAAPPQRAVESLAVNLASSIDVITPLVDTFNTSVANLKALADFYSKDPVPLLRTVGANIGTYFGELTNGQANLIPGQIQKNINTFFYSPWWNSPGKTIPNPDPATFPSDYISSTQTVKKLGVLFGSQSGVYGVAAPLVAGQAPNLTPILEFTATPYSGQLLGLLSPVLSALVQTVRSFTAVDQFVQDGDLIGAINELLNIPTKVTNASLNGAGALDLTAIVQNILPPAIAPLIQAFGLNLGGAITPAVPFNGSLAVTNNPPTVFTGGTLFDSVSAKASVAGIGAQTTGLPVGWAQSVIGLGQFLGKNLLVTPPPPGAAVIAPKAAAVEAAPVATPVEAPPAPVEVPDEVVAEAPADAAPPAVADTPAPAHRGGGNRGGSDNGGNSGGHGHRGAA